MSKTKAGTFKVDEGRRIIGSKKIMKKLSYKYGTSPAEYVGTEDREKIRDPYC